jgi:hypothetical protein
MKQWVNVLTLGVGDLGRARRFYEALGWSTNAAPEDDVAFFQRARRSCPSGIALGWLRTAASRTPGLGRGDAGGQRRLP